jgi:iron complex transport system permease protein
MTRPRVVVAGLLAGCLVISAITLGTGSYRLTPGQVWAALHGQADALSAFVVLGLRLPRLVAALSIGASLAVGGAIFQSVCRNPLASPDVVGFTTGSATGALVSILLLGQNRLGVGAGALMGGMAAAGAVYLLTIRHGLQGERLILTGIGTGAMLSAFNEYLITRADLERAEAAKTWLFGSLNGIAWHQAQVLAIGIVVLLPCALLLAPRLRMLAMGDDLATGLGLAVQRSRLMLMGVAVALTALATAMGGPINFLALAAPPLAQFLCRSPSAGLVPVAAMGALLMVVADFLAQRLMAPFQIPVGLITSVIGGAYLLILLSRRQRSNRGNAA